MRALLGQRAPKGRAQPVVTIPYSGWFWKFSQQIQCLEGKSVQIALEFIFQYLCEKPIIDKDMCGDCWIKETAGNLKYHPVKNVERKLKCYQDVNPDVSTNRSISNPQLEPRWKECGPADRNFLISSCYYCYYYYYYCCDRDCFSNVELYYSQLET